MANIFRMIWSSLETIWPFETKSIDKLLSLLTSIILIAIELTRNETSSSIWAFEYYKDSTCY